MSDTVIYPFNRSIVYEQKTEQQQKKYAQEQSQRPSYDKLVVPADYRPVITTDKPVPGVSDEQTLSKQGGSAVEIQGGVDMVDGKKLYEAQTITSKYWPTVLTTAAIMVIGYVVYTKFISKSKA